MQVVVWLLLAALIGLQQWNPLGADATLVGGVVPVSLVYQAGISVGAGIAWFLVTRCAWPRSETERDVAEEPGGEAVT